MFKENQPKFDDEWEQSTIDDAMKSFGHQEGMTETRALCLSISQLRRLAKERATSMECMRRRMDNLEAQIAFMQKNGEDDAPL